jgi:hypothetical protein
MVWNVNVTIMEIVIVHSSRRSAESGINVLDSRNSRHWKVENSPEEVHEGLHESLQGHDSTGYQISLF